MFIVCKTLKFLTNTVKFYLWILSVMNIFPTLKVNVKSNQ